MLNEYKESRHQSMEYGHCFLWYLNLFSCSFREYLNHPTNLLLKESKKHLGQLASLGALGPLVEDLASENQQEPTPGASYYDHGNYEN